MLLLIVIAVALLAFIIGDALTNSRQIFGNGSTVASVGGKNIDITEYQAKLQELNAQIEQQRRMNPDAADIDQQLVAQEALNQLINDALIDEAVDKMGIQVGSDLLRFLMIENPQNQNVMSLVQQLNANGIAVQTPQQAYTAIFQPQTVGQTAESMAGFRTQWLNLENETRRMIARNIYGNLLSRTVVPNDLDKEMIMADYNTAYSTSFAYKPYGELDPKKYPVSDSELKAAYETLKHNYKVDAPTKSIALITVDVAPSAADQNASKALAAKVRGELMPGKTLAKDTKKAGVAMERHTLRSSDISNDKIKGFLASAPKDSLMVVTNDITGFEIIRMGDRKQEVDSIQINIVQTVSAANLPNRVMARLNGGLGIDSLNTVFKQDSVAGTKEQWIPLYTAAGPNEGFPKAYLDSLYSHEGKYVVLEKNDQVTVLGQLVKKSSPKDIYTYEDVTYRLKPGNNTMADAQQKLGDFLAKNNNSADFVKNAAKAGYTIKNYDLSQFSPAIPVVEGTSTYLPDSRQVVRWVTIDGDPGEVSQIYESKDIYHPQLYAAAVLDEFDEYMPINHRRVSKEVTRYARNQKAGDAWVKQYSGKGNVQQTAAAMGVKAESTTTHFNPFNRGAIQDSPVVGMVAGAKKGQVKVVKGDNGVYVFQVTGTTVEKNPSDDQMIMQQYQGFVVPDMQKMLLGKRKIKNNIYKFEAGN